MDSSFDVCVRVRARDCEVTSFYW